MRRLFLGLLLLVGCDCGGSGPTNPGVFDASTPGDTCGSVRLTSYAAGATGWCEWNRTASFLPVFVRDGLTAAIAEPFNGSSYGGDEGESCGECWEVDTLGGTEVVMIHDLCPIAGNVPCNGSHFHFDLASEAGDALMAGGMDEGSARRVPCPVTGNIHAQVNDQNPTYLRVAFMNHRFPIRAAEIRGAGPGVSADNPYLPFERSGGAFEVSGPGRPLANGGTGLAIRLTSATGDVVESSVAIPSSGADGTTVDLGAQFANASGGVAVCRFTPPGDVYVDAWGGIPSVLWQINPWSGVSADEVSSGCASGSCVRVTGLAQWAGFHLYYRQAFPTTTFTTVTFRARVASGSTSVIAAPSNDGTRCTDTAFQVRTEFAEFTIPIASVCGGLAEINALTIQNTGPGVVMTIDDVRFVP